MIHAPLHLLLVVRLKNALLIVLRDANALICHTNRDAAITVWRELHLPRHSDRCIGWRMFYRVRNKVCQDLLRSLDVESDLDVPQCTKLRFNLDPYLLGLHLMQVHAIFDMLTQIRNTNHWHDRSAFEQLIVQQVLRMTHQQLAAVVYHSTHFP